MADGYRQFQDDPSASGNYDGYAAAPSGPPAYGGPAPPAAPQPGQLGFNVPLQIGYAGHSANFSVPVNAAQLGPGAQYVSQQVQPGGGAGGGLLPKGKWADGLFACGNSPLILIVTCFCPCIRFGLTVNRAMPDSGFLRPCVVWLALYVLFGFLWYIGGAFIGGNWLWIPAVIIFCPIIGYSAYYRMKIRAKYEILGSIVWDFVVDWFCLLCALCQEARHVDRDYGMMV